MSDYKGYLLEISVLTLVGVLIVITLVAWLIHLVKRRHDQTDAEILNAGERIDSLAENMQLDHSAINYKLDKHSGRLQFLTAKEIAAQLAEEKARQTPKQPPPEDISG